MVSLGRHREVDRNVPGDCAPPLSATEITVDYIHEINGGDYLGSACGDQILMGLASADYPLLLAHELRHLFALRHRIVGLMADPPGASLTDGEVFTGHFDQLSALNWLFEFHREEVRRPCHAGICLPIAYQLPKEKLD